jgi:uncharacterized integral membrane protein
MEAGPEAASRPPHPFPTPTPFPGAVAMRYIYGILLILFLGLVIIFSVQNLGDVELRFLNWTVTLPLAVLTVAAYVLGMVSGWSVVGFLRQSYRKVREPEYPR